MRRLCSLATAVAIALIAARADACYSGCFDFGLAFPAVSCAGDGFTRSGATIANNGTGYRWFYCPVPAYPGTDFSWFAMSLAINVTPGTLCYVVEGDAVGTYWMIPPAATRTFSGFIEVDWNTSNLGGSGGKNLSIECDVPPGGKGFQYFEQTLWQSTQ